MSDLALEYSGTLLHHAQARVKVVDGQGHIAPVLCIDIKLDNALHTPMHIEQLFAVGSIEQARAAARRLKKGTRISVQAPLVGLRLVAVNAAHIHVIKQEEALCQA